MSPRDEVIGRRASRQEIRVDPVVQRAPASPCEPAAPRAAASSCSRESDGRSPAETNSRNAVLTTWSRLGSLDRETGETDCLTVSLGRILTVRSGRSATTAEGFTLHTIEAAGTSSWGRSPGRENNGGQGRPFRDQGGGRVHGRRTAGLAADPRDSLRRRPAGSERARPRMGVDIARS